MIRSHAKSIAAIMMAATFLASCDSHEESAEHGHAHGESVSVEEYEHGPHRGRMLRDGDFAVEVTIFEDGADPQFRIYAYRDDEPLAPQDIRLSIELRRLGNKVDRFSFMPQEGFLRGSGVVAEPHSFDVRVKAVEGGEEHEWSYASYEGRTKISAEAAKAGGIKTEIAGSAVVNELIELAGRIEVVPEGKGEVRAQFPGRIVEMKAVLGQQVVKGQTVAQIESSQSLQTYSLAAPISGVIIEKNANTGDVSGERALFVIADPTKLHAEFFVHPRDAERIRPGQAVSLRNAAGGARANAEVEILLPTAELTSQTLIAHVPIPENEAKAFRPGTAVEGSFVVASENVPLAVRSKGLQPFRDFTVVFARVGEAYEVRMLETGKRTPEWTEVLGGIEAGTEYVTDGAFLIRSDIEKAGASHDH